MTLTNGLEIEIENIKVKVKIIERHNNCDNCALKGKLCENRVKYGIKRCYIGNSPIIFEEEQFNYIVDKKT